MEEFLRSARPLVEAETGTTAWFAFKIGPATFGIFDTFKDEDGRYAHVNGEIAKALFAKEIITRFHDAAAASAAEAAFQSIYSGDAVPADVEEQTIPIETPTLWIAKALAIAGLVKSTSDGKRLVEQGGVEVDQQRVTDVQLQLERGKKYLLRVGSKNRRFKYVVVAP